LVLEGFRRLNHRRPNHLTLFHKKKEKKKKEKKECALASFFSCWS